MQKRSLIVLCLGLVIALGTAMSLKSRMATKEEETIERSQVLVATMDIPAGAFVRSDAQLAMVDWPKDNINSSMITNESNKVADFNGAVARRALVKGEAITKNVLVRSTEGGFMSAVLEPGKRAVSIAVDSTSGNAGFIFPGDRVDMILTHLVTRQTIKSRASETFIENVRILAVDQMLDNPENVAVLAKTVTLEVSPKQAEEINLAKDLGKISLSLRSLANQKQEDPIAIATDPETLDDVLNGGGHAYVEERRVTRDNEVSKLISPEQSAGGQVTIIRGNERGVVQFGPESNDGVAE